MAMVLTSDTIGLKNIAILVENPISPIFTIIRYNGKKYPCHNWAFIINLKYDHFYTADPCKIINIENNKEERRKKIRKIDFKEEDKEVSLNSQKSDWENIHV